MRRLWELAAVPLRGARRASIIWALSLAGLIVVTVAFWPSFRDEPGLGDLINGMPQPLIDAFGLADFGTPAGFLRGNLYAVLVPLMLTIAAVLLMNGQTATDEDAGRMEAYLAQPVRRTSIFAGRVVGVAVWLVGIGLVMLIGQLVADQAFDLQIGTDRVVETIVLCLLLAALHAGLAALIAGWNGRPGVVLGVGMGIAVAGYVVQALFPISDILAPWRHASPWDWALGGDPLTTATEAWRYVALGVPAVALAILGALLFARRDVRAA